MSTRFNCLGIWFVILVLSLSLAAQEHGGKSRTGFARINLGGPRLGVTVIPAEGKLYEQLRENDMDGLLSQFGWHFERQIMPKTGGPAFVMEFIPMIAGVEYGKLVPHATIAMGLRLPNGFEFGLGPNVLLAGEDVYSSLVIGLGKSYNYGGVNLPLNLAVATSPDGYRVSLVFGYAIAK